MRHAARLQCGQDVFHIEWMSTVTEGHLRYATCLVDSNRLLNKVSDLDNHAAATSTLDSMLHLLKGS